MHALLQVLLAATMMLFAGVLDNASCCHDHPRIRCILGSLGAKVFEACTGAQIPLDLLTLQSNVTLRLDVS